VITSAQTAGLQFKSSAITSSVTLQITGNEGVQTLSFTSGTSVSAIAFAINSLNDSTGVTASMNTPGNVTSGITFHSSGYGSKNFVSVVALKGTFGGYAGATVFTADFAGR